MSLVYPEFYIIRKYVKMRFKIKGHHTISSVLEVKRSKILQKFNKRNCFFYILGFIFHGISRGKPDFHNKYMI